MTFVAFLICIAVLYWLLLSFLSELTRPDVPDSVLLHFEDSEQHQQRAA